MSKTNKFLFLAVSSIFFAGVAVLLHTYFQPVKNISKQQPDIITSDTKMLSDFDSNSKDADAAYKNKIIELSGTIKKTEVKDSTSTIIFDTGGNYIIVANCVFGINNEVKRLKENSNIKIKGIYSGYIINDDTFMIPAEIKIDKCSIVN
jgi:metal-dependent hydrolase (beta-lactamase superfamily II)